MKFQGLALLLLLISTTSAFAGHENCRHTTNSYYCVEYISNYDGDTITMTIPNIDPNFGEEIGIRVYGVDTAEKSTSDSCELEMAHRAKDEVERVMLRAETIELRSPQRGKYFRIVAEVWVNGRSLARHLLRKNLAVPYFGEEKEDVDWCSFL